MKGGETLRDVQSPSMKGKKLTATTIASSILTSILFAPTAAKAARGAAEMDAEVYLRSLFGQKPSQIFPKQLFTSPRTLNKDFTETILNTLLSTASELTEKSVSFIKEKVESNLPYSLKYFQTFLPIRATSLDDQYYLDVYLYNCYLEIGKLLPRSEDRVNFQRLVGRRLLHAIYSDYLHDTPSERLPSISSQVDMGLRRILNVFNETRLIGRYKLNDAVLLDEEELNSFATDEVNTQHIVICLMLGN